MSDPIIEITSPEIDIKNVKNIRWYLNQGRKDLVPIRSNYLEEDKEDFAEYITFKPEFKYQLGPPHSYRHSKFKTIELVVGWLLSPFMAMFGLKGDLHQVVEQWNDSDGGDGILTIREVFSTRYKNEYNHRIGVVSEEMVDFLPIHNDEFVDAFFESKDDGAYYSGVFLLYGINTITCTMHPVFTYKNKIIDPFFTIQFSKEAREEAIKIKTKQAAQEKVAQEQVAQEPEAQEQVAQEPEAQELAGLALDDEDEAPIGYDLLQNYDDYDDHFDPDVLAALSREEDGFGKDEKDGSGTVDDDDDSTDDADVTEQTEPTQLAQPTTYDFVATVASGALFPSFNNLNLMAVDGRNSASLTGLEPQAVLYAVQSIMGDQPPIISLSVESMIGKDGKVVQSKHLVYQAAGFKTLYPAILLAAHTAENESTRNELLRLASPHAQEVWDVKDKWILEKLLPAIAPNVYYVWDHKDATDVDVEAIVAESSHIIMVFDVSWSGGAVFEIRQTIRLGSKLIQPYTSVAKVQLYVRTSNSGTKMYKVFGKVVQFVPSVPTAVDSESTKEGAGSE